jgi:hypothetical protein
MMGISNLVLKKFLNINRTKINTDMLVEYTKVLEITMLKELGKLAL